MKLITEISIKGFRSLRQQELPRIGSYTSYVGKNSSGKSNVLRALNLYFNNRIEPDRPLDFLRDAFSIPKRKRQITISVSFSLPSNFIFRKGLASLKDTLTDRFSIEKQWEMGPQQQIIQKTKVVVNGASISNSEGLAQQFLDLIYYRYIPNRTVPADILKAESRAVSRSILAKVKGDAGTQELMMVLRSGADKLLTSATNDMAGSGAPLSEITMSTAGSLAEMIYVSGFQAKGQHGGIVRDEDWGAGNQAFFLYQVLKAVDTTYSRSFGWRQATIWGVEEPESGLHRDLETRLAHLFRNWTLETSSKLQIMQTTHSSVFVMASDEGYWVTLENGATKSTPQSIPDLVRDAERKGVSGWVQPVLAYPNDPVALVEGAIDAEVLSHVARVAGFYKIRFVSLPQLDPAEKGAGKDAITAYLKRHSGLLSNRPREAPLIVLFDWEVSKQELDAAQKAYAVNGELAVSRMNPAHCSPELGEDFKGIERFYPSSIIKDAAGAGEFGIAQAPGRPISISSSELSIAKHKLRVRLTKITESDKLQAFVNVVADVEHTIKSLQTAQQVLPLHLSQRPKSAP